MLASLELGNRRRVIGEILEGPGHGFELRPILQRHHDRPQELRSILDADRYRLRQAEAPVCVRLVDLTRNGGSVHLRLEPTE